MRISGSFDCDLCLCHWMTEHESFGLQEHSCSDLELVADFMAILATEIAEVADNRMAS